MEKKLKFDFLPKPYEQMINSIMLYNNPFSISNEEREKSLAIKVPDKGETLYYAGCMASIKYKQIMNLTVKILSKLGYKVAMLKSNEVCCGGFLSMLGLEDEFKKIAELNIKKVQESNAKEVITTCPMCLKTIKHDYEEIGIKVPFKVMHISEIIAKAIKGLKFEDSLKGIKSVYHDPCHLGRSCGIYEEPREILNKIPGLVYLEIPFYNKEESLCCGGFLKSTFPSLATAISEIVFSEAGKLNINSIITSCPTCFHNFLFLAPEFNLQVYDLIELVAAAMGIVELKELNKF